MKKHEIIKYMNVTSDIHAKMPDIEQVREKCLNQSTAEMTVKENIQKKRSAFKSTKILATAAALVLIIGLVNIQTVIAFISGLFFVPGAGVTRESVTYYGLEEPVDIETDYGLLTLKFANKITMDNRADLWFYIYSTDIPASRAYEDYPLYISITANGETIVSDEKILGGGGWGSDGRNYVGYGYLCEDFPQDANEFNLTVLGVETNISLIFKPNNFALSEENNGITLAASKFRGVTDMLAKGVFDNSESANDFNIIGDTYFDDKYYDENGDEIRWTSGWSGMTEFYENEKEIKALKANQVELMYSKYGKEPLAIEIPVPKDGETISVNIEIAIGSHTFRITEVRRDGDTIYYEKNSHEILTAKSHADMNTGSFTSGGIPTAWDKDLTEYNKAIANKESYIKFINFGHDGDWDVNKSKMGGGEIWDFNENAKTLTFYFKDAHIIQFGNFDITFD